jgi:hypothetical protein
VRPSSSLPRGSRRRPPHQPVRRVWGALATEAAHTIWPWTEYLVSVLAQAYEDFENRIAAAHGTDGLNKQERVRHWVETSAPAAFKLRDVRRALPRVSDETIRLALKPLKERGRLRVAGAGPGARWVKQH